MSQNNVPGPSTNTDREYARETFIRDRRLRLNDRVAKFSGAYGGPGRVVAVFGTDSGDVRYVVAFKIVGGFGEFYDILTDRQLARQHTTEEGYRHMVLGEEPQQQVPPRDSTYRGAV